MLKILLNESDPMRHQMLRTKLQKHGCRVWSVAHFDDIKSPLQDIAFDLMIFDLDTKRIDEVIDFATHWKDSPILFQSSSLDFQLDSGSWIADKLVYKSKNGKNILQAVDKLITRHNQGDPNGKN
ncbi:MAG: hypothetical protein ACE5G1_07490 [bacterium]